MLEKKQPGKQKKKTQKTKPTVFKLFRPSDYLGMCTKSVIQMYDTTCYIAYFLKDSLKLPSPEAFSARSTTAYSKRGTFHCVHGLNKVMSVLSRASSS